MIAELGQWALVLALGVALVQAVVPIAGAARGRADWMALARSAAQAQALLVTVAFACLTVLFVRNDFSVLYVASNSNTALPLAYRIAAVWGGHEGSLLLWLLMLELWTLAVASFSAGLPAAFVARVIGVLGAVAAGFLLFTLLASNPFDRLLPAAPEGRDLNPLLQDPGMVIHPPMLFMGYVGFSVAFAFAIAALLGGRLDNAWARWTRPWTTAAWAFLTVGIALGSWWAYYELGWGGWWFWDPVENASFMPWLVGTALIHSLAVTEKRGAFKSWTVLLAILAFSLSLLGTFLVRSGVLSSVHAFATDPKRGLFILGFLVVVVGGSLALYAWRAPKVGLGARFETVSRETLLLGNNVLLTAAMLTVLLGTLYPLALDALGLGKISVGPPYFDSVFVPMMVPLVLLMGVGPLARWRAQPLPDLARRVRWAAALSGVAALASGWAAGEWSAGATLGLLMAWWIVFTVGADVAARLRVGPGRWMPAWGQVRLLPRALVGMWVAHLGVAAFAAGVSMVSTYGVERDVSMRPGESTTLGDHVFTFRGVVDVEGPNYSAARGRIDVSRDGREVTTLRPEKRLYRTQPSPTTEAAIHPGPWRDLYVSLGEPLDGGDGWIVRLYVKPFVDWIWFGCGLMALGGALALSDRRYRRASTAPAHGPAGIVEEVAS